VTVITFINGLMECTHGGFATPSVASELASTSRVLDFASTACCFSAMTSRKRSTAGSPTAEWQSADRPDNDGAVGHRRTIADMSITHRIWWSHVLRSVCSKCASSPTFLPFAKN
jgi:hypothetical protein